MTFNFQAAAQGTNGSGPALSEKFDAKINLLPTPDAPEDAKGKAQLKAEADDSGQTGTLSLQTIGLEPGDYNLRLIKASDAGTVDLGQFTIEDPDGNTNNNRKLKSMSETDLPADLDVGDVAQVVVSSGGTDLLIGDLADATSKSKAKFNATVPLTPGEAAPDATGFAKLRTTISKGVVKNKLTLIGSGMPTNSVLSVEVDGIDAGTVTSNKKGKVVVKSLPEGFTNIISTVRLLTDTSAEAARADF